MLIRISNDLQITKVPEPFLQDLKTRLTVENPKWIENEKMGRWNGETPRHLQYYTEAENKLTIPRGFIRHLLNMAHKAGVAYQTEDHRRALPEVNLSFCGTLKPFQRRAVDTMLKKDFGTLSAPPGSGKTVMALSIIVERKQSTLIIVHSKELLNQWGARITCFLDIPKNEIGIIGNGKMKIGDKITVGIINSINPIADEIKDHFGHIVVDECHRTPSRTFTDAVTAFDSRYMLGLSATPWRRDGLSKLIFWHLGDVLHEVEKTSLVESGDILTARVIIRETDFVPFSDASNEYSKMLSELTENSERNALIVKDIKHESVNKGVCLVLSDRKTHCEVIAGVLNDSGVTADVLTGATPNKAREAIVTRLNSGNVKVLIATGQLIGEGFDCSKLSTLFMATPIKFSGRLIQYVGRVLRPAQGKDRATVYDYVDSRVAVLRASAKSRQGVYNQWQGV